MAAINDQLLLVHGEERFLVDAAVRGWKERVRARSPALDIEVFDAPAKLEGFRQSIAEVPLFDPARSVLLRDPPQLATKARRGSDSPDALAAALAERAPTTSLCIVSHDRIAAQSPVLAAVRTLRGSISYFPPQRARDVRTWLDRAIADRGLSLGRGSVEHLLQAAGTDLGALTSELDKLQAYAAGRPLTAAQVARAVAGDEPPELYGVVEHLIGQNPASGAAVLDELLADGRSSQHLLSIISGQLRDLILAQAYMRVRGNAIGLAAELRIPDWRAERLARQARSVPPALAIAWLGQLHEVDRQIKNGEIGDLDALRLFGLGAAAQVVGTRSG